jgi:hypothetical protein
MTKINNLASEIVKEMKKYSKEIEDEMESAKKEVSSNLVKELKAKSPERLGRYKKGWRIKKFKTKYVVHNKTDYQLTHLLEYGHVLRNGKRSKTLVHIRPAEEDAVAEYLARLRQVIK